MKRLFIASLATIALAAGPAFAADLPVPYKAPLMPAPAPSWTGCYVNGGGGYGMWNQDHYNEDATTLVRYTDSPTVTTGGEGWFGEVGGGCDYQFQAFNNWNVVIGAFGDYDFMNINGSLSGPFSTAFSGNENQSSAWFAGARAGVLVTPSLLTYISGGYTETNFDQTDFTTARGIGFLSLASNTYNGWFIGGGTEYALTFLPIPGLFWRNEYRYSSYQGADVPVIVTTSGAPTATDVHADKFVQTISTELVWRFNWPAPLAVRD